MTNLEWLEIQYKHVDIAYAGVDGFSTMKHWITADNSDSDKFPTKCEFHKAFDSNEELLAWCAMEIKFIKVNMRNSDENKEYCEEFYINSLFILPETEKCIRRINYEYMNDEEMTPNEYFTEGLNFPRKACFEDILKTNRGSSSNYTVIYDFLSQLEYSSGFNKPESVIDIEIK